MAYWLVDVGLKGCHHKKSKRKKKDRNKAKGLIWVVECGDRYGVPQGKKKKKKGLLS